MKITIFTQGEQPKDVFDKVEKAIKKGQTEGDDPYFRVEGEYRICSECGDVMTEGYYIEGDFTYYCSDKCLFKNMTRKEYKDLYDEELAYWTEWEDYAYEEEEDVE